MGWTGGGSAPQADPNIGAAQKQLADLSTEQWNMFKNDVYPELLRQAKVAETRADEVWASDKKIADFQLKNAETDRANYENYGLPAAKRLVDDANMYNTAGYQEQMAGQAIGDIEAAQAVSREDQAMRDRAYGINPTSGRSAAAANASNIQYALAKASAATQTREAAKQLGLQKQANVFNMASGLPAQALASSNSAVSSGGAGLAAGESGMNATLKTSGATNAATGTAMQGWGNVGSLGVGKYNADINRYNAEAASNPWNMVLGAAAGVGTKVALGKFGG